MTKKYVISAGMVNAATHKKLQLIAKCLGMRQGECVTWLIEAGFRGIEEKSKMKTPKKAGK
jgi:hypothetical protein